MTAFPRTFALFLLLSLAPATAAEGQTGVSGGEVDCAPFERAVEAFMDSARIPGAAVAVTRGGSPVCEVIRGVSNLELGAPVTRTTVFEIASLTKQMTAALVAGLAEEGRLSLDDSLRTYLDEIPEGWAPITLRQLLGHMGGLEHRFEPRVGGTFLLDYDRQAMLEGARATPMRSTPGTDWEYSDQGYFLAGLAVERATGRTFDELMEERFFEPLGMTRTRFLDQDDIIEGRASGYTVVDGEWKNDRRSWEFALTPHFGVMSTLADMIRWERGLVEHTAVSEAVQSEITSPYRHFDVPVEGHDLAYGLGWQIHDFTGRRIVEHAGSSGTFYLRDLASEVAVIILTNRDSDAGPHPSILGYRLAELIDPALGGLVFQ